MEIGGTNISTEKQTLLVLRALRERVDELEGRLREPIAIIGMACRFPGGANTPEEYWNLLVQGQDAVCEIPPQRMELDGLFDSRPQTPGKTYSRWAGLLEEPGNFDAEFFGISPREAITMDPQQRLLLEVSWEALEDAAINPKTLTGKSAAVFVGISTSEYAQLLQRIIPREQLGAYVLQGSALNAAAGRLSYFYGLNGPSMAIDTACSSSLVAVDRACRSLRDGESQLTIAAGVNLLAVPESLIVASQWGILSPSGKIKAFDISADGFVRAEGCGVVILKRLSEATRDGDRTLGLILGSAVNQDGASSGLTVPNGLAQQELLREAHRRAGIDARQVGYVEAHGTGTSLGDPIEAEALGEVFNGARAQKLPIGSVKTNVGHLESAAGIAGLIKVVLSLRHQSLPAQLHWQQPSEHVQWGELPLEVVTENRYWQPIEGRRIGGVSSFGFTGTNAHVVVEEWQEETAAPHELAAEDVLVLSARSEPGLRALAERYASFLLKSEASWRDICYTAGIGRATFGERLAVVANGRVEAAEVVHRWLRGEQPDGVHRGQVSESHRAERSKVAAAASSREIAAAFVTGATVDWAVRAHGQDLRRVGLPTYAFQRERYWIEAPPSRLENDDSADPALLNGGMLGKRMPVAGVRAQYEASLSAQGWVGDHMVDGRVMLPATAHLELMLEAGAACLDTKCALEDVILQSPLTVDGTRRIQTVVEEQVAGRNRVRVYAERSGGEWERISEGWLRNDETSQKGESTDLQAIRKRLLPRSAGDRFYDEMASRGLVFGERFRGVEQAWAGPLEALGEIVARQPCGPGWELAPWWLDACLQIAGMVNDSKAGLYLPLAFANLHIYGSPGERSWSHVTMHRIDSETVSAEVNITDATGSTLVSLSGVRFRKVPMRAARASLYRTEWVEASPALFPIEFKGHWIVISSPEDLGTQICSELRGRGARCSLLHTGRVKNVNGADTYYLAGSDTTSHREALRKLITAHGAVGGILDLRAAVTADLSMIDSGLAAPEDLPAVDACIALLQALLLEQIHPARGVYLLTWNSTSTSVPSLSAQGHAIQALRRTVILEFPELAIRSLDFDAGADARRLVSVITGVDGDEMMMRGGFVLVPRLKEKPETATGANREVVPAQTGLIEDLRSVLVDRKAPLADEVEIEVRAQGVNFRDVMTSLGMLPGEIQRIGGECAGVVTEAGPRSGFATGERVFAFTAGSFRDYVTAKGANVTSIPEGLSFSQAAGLPVAYLTALYGLDRLAGLQPGESILIHAAAGGLGLAAVHVARARGAVVFATAGSEEKRAYLRTLGVQHTLPSRTTEFADEVLRLTNGRGVDVVLNSLTGALAEKTLSITATGGRFLEVGKRDTLSTDMVRKIRPDVSHFVYDLGEEAANDPTLVPSLMQEILHSLASGAISPLPITEFTDPKDAFRFMAQARHTGKLIVTKPDAGRRSAQLKFDAAATYLITGGCGALGLISAEWLVDRGARHLLLMGRSAPSATARAAIERMQACGADVTVVTADVADRNSVECILLNIPSCSPLKGVLHAAGELDDHNFLAQSPGSLKTALHPKWKGAWNLHTLTRDNDLDFFVLFSSAAALVGSPGQANYAVANAMLDALAEHRRSLGLSALSIQWGPWNASGMTDKVKVDPQSIGMEKIDALDGVKALEGMLGGEDAVAAVLPVFSWERFVSERPQRTSSLFSSLICTEPQRSPAGTRQEAQRERLFEVLTNAAPKERRSILLEHLRQQTVQILSLPSQTRIDQDEILHDLGMDSLMAVELRNALIASLDRQFPPTMVLDYPTLRTLADYMLTSLFAETRSLEAGISNDITTMTDQEAEQLLLSELGREEHGAAQ